MNLLPEKEKANLKKGLKLRFAVTLLVLLSIPFFFGSIILLPSYLLALVNFSETKTENGPAINDNNQEFQDVLNMPDSISGKLLIFQSNLSGHTALEILNKFINAMPTGVKINSISFSKRNNNAEKIGSSVIISGIAQNRESLVSFSSNLKKDSDFSSVEIPISNLAKEKNLPFSINIFIKEK